MQVITTLAFLRTALTQTPEKLKELFAEVTAWLKMVRDETPVRLKNVAKVIHVILEERTKLIKSKSLGLDAGASRVQFVEKWLGAKPNQAMFFIETALCELPEGTFDAQDINVLRRFGQIAQKANAANAHPSLGDWKASARALIVSGTKESAKAFFAICDRVVELDERLVFLSPEEYAIHIKDSETAASVSAAANLDVETLSQLLEMAQIRAGKATPKDVADLENTLKKSAVKPPRKSKKAPAAAPAAPAPAVPESVPA